MNISDRTIQVIAAVLVAPMLALGAYSGLAAAGKVAPAPWSPLGQHQQQIEKDRQEQIDSLMPSTGTTNA